MRSNAHRPCQRLGRFFDALRSHPPAASAVTDATATVSYAQLLARADQLRTRLTPLVSAPSSQSHRCIALFLQPQTTFVTALLATWGLPAIAVPLSPLYPPNALLPLLQDADPTVVLAQKATLDGLPEQLDAHVVLADQEPSETSASFMGSDSLQQNSVPHPTDRAMLMFTSGTTGRAKGVVWTHSMIDYQVATMTDAWQWSQSDRVLNVLPLHHIHGLVNVVLTAMYNGAHLEMFPSFSAHDVWHAIMRPQEATRKPPTVFMAVPAIYNKLIQYYNVASDAEQYAMREAASRVRLFVCGSASLARCDFEAWQAISGKPLLERYGMTETGMTLSNLYDQRIQGRLGHPLPGVNVRVDDTPEHPDYGRLYVRGPGVFKEYWRRPAETEKAFTNDGWFDTGDVVEKDAQSGSFRMIGRASSDIIKTGGYKVSALEIEELLRDCPGVNDCCVVGVSDHVLGQRIVAAIVSPLGESVIPVVGEWASDRLPKYKVPRKFLVVEDFPRNVLGKVQKQVLRAQLE